MRNIDLEIEYPNFTRTDFFKNWFSKRGLKLVEYQQDILSNKLIFSEEKIVLAVSPSGGKTLMSIAAIEKYCLDNKTHKVLVLTHGQTVLRSQYATDIEAVKPSFTWGVVVSSFDMDNKLPQIKSKDICKTEKQVIISLPQSIRKTVLPHFDLVVVDEAHQFYFAKMVQAIIKKTNPQHQLLLTGTPSPFIAKNFKTIIPVSIEILNENGMVSDPIIEVAGSSYDFKLSDYNENFELKEEIDIKKEDTNSTLNMVLIELCKKIRVNTDWNNTLKTLSKTMLVCRNQKQAKDVYEFFNKRNINSSLSVSGTDKDSSEIARFKKEEDCLILIVVRRGILGFNFPSLATVIDISCSQNVDNLLQLLCRVVRISPTNEQKVFYKVCPIELVDHFKYVMTAVLCLTNQEYFKKFNGKNFLDIKIPVVKQISKLNGNKTRMRYSANQKRKFKPIELSGLPAFNFFKKYVKEIDNDVLNSYAYTTLREVSRNIISKRNFSKQEVLEMCKNSFVDNDCITISDYQKLDYPGYKYLLKNNLLSKFYQICNIKKMKSIWIDLPKVEVFIKCKSKFVKNGCKSMMDYRNVDKTGYLHLVSNKWLDEFYNECGIVQIKKI